MPNGLTWSSAEDRVVYEMYPTGGYQAVIRHLPHRTKKSVKRRASILKQYHTSSPFSKRPRNRSLAIVPAQNFGELDWLAREWRGPVSGGTLRSPV